MVPLTTFGVVGRTVGVGVAVATATGVGARTVFVVGAIGGGLSEPELEHAEPLKSTTSTVRRSSGFITK